MFSKSSLHIVKKMRTKEQQTSKSRRRTMMHQIKTVLRNSRLTLIQDMLGAALLVVMMVVALHAPGFG
jgi:hypothetical protein